MRCLNLWFIILTDKSWLWHVCLLYCCAPCFEQHAGRSCMFSGQAARKKTKASLSVVHSVGRRFLTSIPCCVCCACSACCAPAAQGSSSCDAALTGAELHTTLPAYSSACIQLRLYAHVPGRQYLQCFCIVLLIKLCGPGGAVLSWQGLCCPGRGCAVLAGAVLSWQG